MAPATFAQLLARVAPKLPFAAWATHPYPSDFALGPDQRVAYPNVSFSTLSRFGASLASWFHRPVPIWVTEYGEQTTPQFAGGVSDARQATDVRRVLKLAAANRYVQMFVWFILRDSGPGTWSSGLETASGAKKPAYAAFAAAAASLVGTTEPVSPGRPVTVALPVPFMAYHDPAGTTVGVTYALRLGSRVVALGQPRARLLDNETIRFSLPHFLPLRGKSYELTAVVNDRHGQTEHQVVALVSGEAPAAPIKLGPRAG